MSQCNQYSISTNEMQEELIVLQDKSRTGRERPWSRKKEYNMKLAEIYKGIDFDKSVRIENCGQFLEFVKTDDGMKLKSANFCRVRLCPMCQWRRSLKVYNQMTKVFNALSDEYSIICLNLTVANCKKEELSETLNLMSEAFNRLVKYKDIANAVKGYYRATEITHNLDKKSPSYGTFHPHFHCLLVVDKGYFKSKNYLSKDKWVSLWKKALRASYEPIVYVRRLYLKDGQDITSALCEVTKYTVKEEEIVTGDYDLDYETVSVLDKALEKRKFMTLGGILKDLHKKLNLVDLDDDSDLVNVDDDSSMSEGTKERIVYAWHSGYKQYVRQ